MIADHSIFYTYTHVAKGITHTHNGSLTILVYKCFRFVFVFNRDIPN